MLHEFKSDSFITALGLTAALGVIGLLNAQSGTSFAHSAALTQASAASHTVPQAIAQTLSVHSHPQATAKGVDPAAKPIALFAPGRLVAAITPSLAPLDENPAKLHQLDHKSSSLIPAIGAIAPPAAPVESAPASHGALHLAQFSHPIVSYLESLKTCVPDTFQFGQFSSQIVGWEGDRCRTESSMRPSPTATTEQSLTCLFSSADLAVLTQDAVMSAAATQDFAALQDLTQTVQQLAARSCE